MLDQVKRADEECTEAEGEDDRSRLVSWTIEIGHALSHYVRPSRAQSLPCRPRQKSGARRQGENGDSGCRAHAECLSRRSRARKGDGDNAQDQRRVHDQSWGIPPSHPQHVGVGIAAKRLQRGDVA